MVNSRKRGEDEFTRAAGALVGTFFEQLKRGVEYERSHPGNVSGIIGKTEEKGVSLFVFFYARARIMNTLGWLTTLM